MFGVTDLFTILAGGVWLTKEAVKSSLELEENKANARQIFDFIEEHTDEILESKCRAYIDNPECSEQIWEMLESFKRDKMTVAMARLEAEKKYPLPHSK